MNQSIDQANKVAKAQAEVKSATDDLAVKQSEVFRAQAAEEEIRARLQGVQRELVALDAQACSTDPNDEPALHRLSTEQSFLETQLAALEGAAKRAKAAREKAQDLDSAASASVVSAEQVLKRARSAAQECEFDAQEARYRAAGEPLPQHLAERAAFRERIAEEDRQRESRSIWNEVTGLWDSGEAVLSHDQHTAAQRMFFDYIQGERRAGRRPSDKQLVDRMKEVIMDARMTDIRAVPRQTETPSHDQADPGDVRWRKTLAPSHPAASIGKISGGTETTYDPFSKEND